MLRNAAMTIDSIDLVAVSSLTLIVLWLIWLHLEVSSARGILCAVVACTDLGKVFHAPTVIQFHGTPVIKVASLEHIYTEHVSTQ
jgi:hypothetical protein